MEPKILTGSNVQLEPLNKSHKHELCRAAQDETIWTYNSSSAFGYRFYRWFDKAITNFELKRHLPFIIRRLSDQKIIGSTRYYDINITHQRLAIGYTWYIPEVWGTQVNSACKLLLLTFAFENLKFNRIEFVIDSRNKRSLSAIKKLGAIEEGLLRHHMILDDGFVRDSVVFSIIKPDWTQVKLTLLSRII